MAAYLKIENPGVAPAEAFTLLGASTKRGSENTNTIGKFGTGNKHGVAVLLRQGMSPTVFAGNLKMEFGTRVQTVNDGLRNTDFNRVVVKFGGKDAQGVSRTSTEDLGFVLEHGSADWLSVDLALREFVSNSIDRAIEEGESRFLQAWFSDKDEEYITACQRKEGWQYYDAAEKIKAYRQTATDWKDVSIEVVNDSQVRAKAGTTRIFIPLTVDVLSFYDNLGKWFLHFSEPELLNETILPKSNRNLGDRKTAVIYRRGVRVREFESTDTASLFDYNLENLKLDESRRVDDWYVQYEAAKALANAPVESLARMWQSFLDQGQYWEHTFQTYGLEFGLDDNQKKSWNEAFEKVVGETAVISTAEGAEVAQRKGYKVCVAPQAFVQAAEKHGLRTPAKVLSEDDQLGRQVFDPTPDAIAAVEYAWDLVTKHGVTNGRSMPKVKTFRKVMDAGSQTLGYYKDGTIFINQDIAGSGSVTLGWHALTQQLMVTALEEVAHHVTGAGDNSRDFQDFLLNLIVYCTKV